MLLLNVHSYVCFLRSAFAIIIIYTGSSGTVIAETEPFTTTTQPTHVRDHQKLVFIVDDSLDVQDLFKYLAKINGFDLATAQNGAEALVKLSQLEHEPSTLFVDLNMPVMNGADFLAKVREQGLAKNSRIVIFSAAERSHFAPVDPQMEWLRKPFNLSDVIRTINMPAKSLSPTSPLT
jgi:CheY-like chemotaxis protein